jgi:protein-S-isoprenylcysteine O-methyltransferase Ste14
VLSITKQALTGLTALVVLLWLALFLPAWTLDYWKAWTYWLVFLVCITAISVYFLKKDLNLIASRLKVGPAAEKEGSQKITQAFVSVFFVLLLLIPSIDHHFQWSNVPAYLVFAGEVFVGLGLLIVFLVFKENSYTPLLLK